mmetsp:Transcript_92485/g.167050  ORF Transcript_92485/g.167050 Transcript_92485/m.167050 type:complete len:254 (-) Transcript_92485:112-873(-)
MADLVDHGASVFLSSAPAEHDLRVLPRCRWVSNWRAPANLFGNALHQDLEGLVVRGCDLVEADASPGVERRDGFSEDPPHFLVRGVGEGKGDAVSQRTPNRPRPAVGALVGIAGALRTFNFHQFHQARSAPEHRLALQPGLLRLEGRGLLLQGLHGRPPQDAVDVGEVFTRGVELFWNFAQVPVGHDAAFRVVPRNFVAWRLPGKIRPAGSTAPDARLRRRAAAALRGLHHAGDVEALEQAEVGAEMPTHRGS